MPLHCPVIFSSFSSLPLHKNLPNRVSFFVVIVLFCFLLLLLFTPFPRAPGHFTEVVCSHLVWIQSQWTKEILVLLGIILLSQASEQMSHGYLQQFFSPSFHTEGLFHVGCQEPGSGWSTCKSKGPTESAFSCWRLNHVVFTWRLLHGFYYIWVSVAYIQYPVDLFIFSKTSWKVPSLHSHQDSWELQPCG